MKAVLDVTDGDIEGWLEEERHFLQNLKSEPEERVLEISYVEALIARDKAEYVNCDASHSCATDPTAVPSCSKLQIDFV